MKLALKSFFSVVLTIGISIGVQAADQESATVRAGKLTIVGELLTVK